MPEQEKPSIIDRLVQAATEQILSGVGRTGERFAKRTIRRAGLVIAGVIVSMLGVAFLALGIVKLLAFLMPSWLAWLIVGLILVLLGALLTLANSRS